jgi:hypothetical protein
VDLGDDRGCRSVAIGWHCNLADIFSSARGRVICRVSLGAEFLKRKSIYFSITNIIDASQVLITFMS